MSTINYEKSIPRAFYVIAMAFGCQPVKLKCLIDQAMIVKVAGENSDEWMGYPKQYLFEFNKELFDKLKDAYIKEDKTYLNYLWREARPLSIKR